MMLAGEQTATCFKLWKGQQHGGVASRPGTCAICSDAMQKHSSFHEPGPGLLHVAGLLQCKYTLLSFLPLVAAGDYSASCMTCSAQQGMQGIPVQRSAPPPPPPPSPPVSNLNRGN